MHLRTLLPLAAAMSLAAPSGAAANFAHTISPGESLYSVAAADGLSVSELAAANGIGSSAPLITGRTLMIPPQGGGVSGTAGSVSSGSGVSASTAGSTSAGTVGDGDGDADDVGTTSSTGSSSSSGGSAGGYVVQSGDTLSAIAARAGTSVASLAAANGLDPNGLLPTGVSLHLSGSGGGSSSASFVSSGSGSSSAVSSLPQTSSATSTSGPPPYPTPEHVSGSQVASIASANGVPASLAQAIGWQESGFNNDLVSSADARGVMQILPSTWDWIQNNLTPANPLAAASASENVRGGVLLLHSLLSSTGGDPALAAAGYYQGLGSVRQRGMFSDTQQYVNSVMALRRHFGGP
jgi:LysM repeat protein